jgi:homoserine dehydrogenase
MPARELAIALVGFGNVARRFVRLLEDAEERLDFDWRLVAVGTRRHGSLIAADGIDVRQALSVVASGGTLDDLAPSPRHRSGIDVIRQVSDGFAEEAADGRLVVIETSVLDVQDGEPATAHVHAALEGLAHVITANKGPVAFAYHALERLARSVDRQFLFEGVVMDGVPVFNLVRETLPGAVVQGFRGIINTTCQYALCEMSRGSSLDAAIAEMQRQGIAEADASHDIEGWDAAAKTAALVNVLMGGRITPHLVMRSGIDDVSSADVAEAAAQGRCIRLVASAAWHGPRLEARVEPELLDGSDPLASLGAVENALFLRTDMLGEIGIVQRSSSLRQTAYALLTDLTAISRRL